jgi:hypothetical protein
LAASPERVTLTNANSSGTRRATEETQSFTEFFSVVLCAFSAKLCVPLEVLRANYTVRGSEFLVLL